LIWGNPRKLEWGGNGEGDASSRATWDQGGRDLTTQEEGFQVSKRDLREGRNWQGKTSKGNNKRLRHKLSIVIYVRVS
jgi:hypothetical protein